MKSLTLLCAFLSVVTDQVDSNQSWVSFRLEENVVRIIHSSFCSIGRRRESAFGRIQRTFRKGRRNEECSDPPPTAGQPSLQSPAPSFLGPSLFSCCYFSPGVAVLGFQAAASEGAHLLEHPAVQHAEPLQGGASLPCTVIPVLLWLSVPAPWGSASPGKSWGLGYCLGAVSVQVF